MAQRKGNPSENFWTWRGAMFNLAESLTPESIDVLSRQAFRELRLAGVRTVGEFHYIHHQSGGHPYDDRTLLAGIVIRAALDEGLRITLLRTAYNRGGFEREIEPAQLRFSDPSVDDVIRDTETLLSRYANEPRVCIGLAPHSVRAVPPEWLAALGQLAERHNMPLHMHVAEQVREVDECIAETGRRPLAFIADSGLLSDRFCAVHATQLSHEEAQMLGNAGAFACLCPTTERDLGDGIADITALREAGVRLCTGIDSHIVTDPIEELRSLETHERLRTRARITFDPQGATPAEALWLEGSLNGALACGFTDAGGEIALDAEHESLRFVEADQLLDAVVFSGTANALVVNESARR
jgi:formiminoglutamate deiminase